MINEFEITDVAWGDPAGFGLWEIGHYRQHRNYVMALAPLGLVLPDYPILRLLGDRGEVLIDWLNQHGLVHGIICAALGINGVNLADLDPRSPASFYEWELLHAQEHQAFDQALTNLGATV